jgi:hypothetical protein
MKSLGTAKTPRSGCFVSIRTDALRVLPDYRPFLQLLQWNWCIMPGRTKFCTNRG